MHKASFNRKIILIHSALLAVFVGYTVLYNGNELVYYDEHDYVAIARNISLHQWYSIDGEQSTAFRAPVFPLFLSVFISMGANIAMLKIVNAVLLVGTSLLLSILLNSLYGSTTGIISSVLVFLYPVLIYTAGTLYPQILGSFFLVLSLFIMFFKNRDTFILGSLLGIVLGLLVLTIPTLSFVGIVVFFWLALKNRKYRTTVAAIALIVTIIGVWMARNFYTFNEIVFISTNSGINLLLGNSENTTPNAGTRVDIEKYDKRAPKGSETELDRFYFNEAIRYISENKSRSLLLYYQKVLNHFNYRNDFKTDGTKSWIMDIIMALSYVPLLLLLFIRLLYTRTVSLSEFERISILLYFCAAFVQAVFFTRIRFRIPFDFLLIAVSAVTLSQIFMKNRFLSKLFPDTTNSIRG